MKKASKYRRITWTDRLKIEALYNTKHSFQFIADELGFVKSAIYYEVQHGLYDHLDGKTWLTVKRYSATIAQDYSNYQATAKGVSIKLGNNYDYANHVAERIKDGDSPDVIVHTLRKQNKWTVSTSTLYRYIDQGYIPGITPQTSKKSRTVSQQRNRRSKPPAHQRESALNAARKKY